MTAVLLCKIVVDFGNKIAAGETKQPYIIVIGSVGLGCMHRRLRCSDDWQAPWKRRRWICRHRQHSHCLDIQVAMSHDLLSVVVIRYVCAWVSGDAAAAAACMSKTTVNLIARRRHGQCRCLGYVYWMNVEASAHLQSRSLVLAVNPLNLQWCQTVTFTSIQCHSGLSARVPECQKLKM